MTSTDDGVTWSAPTDIPRSTGYYGSSLASGITHSSGRLVGCMRKICRNSCTGKFRSKSFWSDDHGASWRTSRFLAAGTTECQVAELSDGRLYMSIRANDWPVSNQRLVSYSSDVGETWSKPAPDARLVDWGFADEGSVVSDPRNKVVYYSHPDSHERHNLTLRRSVDDTVSWGDEVVVYAGDAEYSAAAVLDPFPGSARRVGVLFERDGNALVSFDTVQY